jgi:hypothetical protein
MNAVVVEFAVEEEIKKSGVVASDRASIERRAPGVDEAPIPKLPALEKMRAVEVAVPFVEVENERYGVSELIVEFPAIESVAYGVEDPKPRY